VRGVGRTQEVRDRRPFGQAGKRAGDCVDAVVSNDHPGVARGDRVAGKPGQRQVRTARQRHAAGRHHLVERSRRRPVDLDAQRCVPADQLKVSHTQIVRGVRRARVSGCHRPRLSAEDSHRTVHRARSGEDAAVGKIDGDGACAGRGTAGVLHQQRAAADRRVAAGVAAVGQDQRAGADLGQPVLCRQLTVDRQPITGRRDADVGIVGHRQRAGHGGRADSLQSARAAHAHAANRQRLGRRDPVDGQRGVRGDRRAAAGCAEGVGMRDDQRPAGSDGRRAVVAVVPAQCQRATAELVDRKVAAGVLDGTEEGAPLAVHTDAQRCRTDRRVVDHAAAAQPVDRLGPSVQVQPSIHHHVALAGSIGKHVSSGHPERSGADQRVAAVGVGLAQDQRPRADLGQIHCAARVLDHAGERTILVAEAYGQRVTSGARRVVHRACAIQPADGFVVAGQIQPAWRGDRDVAGIGPVPDHLAGGQSQGSGIDVGHPGVVVRCI